MKETFKEFLIVSVAGAVMYKMIYTHGYNRGRNDVADKLKLMINVYDAAKNEIKEES